jgi:hypothetical protein
VPFWFHTFALNRADGLYTPGVARDHRYRIPALPACFDGLSVLDVGTFDGFYAFLAEARGARRVMAIYNEQYRLWVRTRWGVALAGGEGFHAIQRLLGSSVEYRCLDASSYTGSTSASTSSIASGSCTASRARSVCCDCSAIASPRAAGCPWRPTARSRRRTAR